MEKAHATVIDELLVMHCQAGDRKSFDLLVRRWQRRLWQYARRLTGSDDAAWDVIQEAWMAILKQIRNLSDPAWFAAWAYRIVRNKCVDYCRRASRQRNLAESLIQYRTLSGDPPTDEPGAGLARALQQLPSERQELLTLKYGEDLNILEIAVVLGIPVGTVKSRLHHAREHLRRILEGDES
ncbi:MAG: RNA polymerase sigma factor [Planctomycetes bacterium]|nr:RNA polymerase sigma factor [Planctomycetota bacterium]